MLKHRIYNLNEVGDKLKPLYEKQADGSYVLCEDARPDNTELLKFTETLKEEKKALKEEKAALAASLAKIKEDQEKQAKEALQAEGKFKELYELEVKKIQQRAKEAEDKAAGMQARIKANAEDSAITAIASELAGANALLLAPHIASSVTAEVNDAGVVEVSYNLNGEAMDKETFIKSVQENVMFKPILKGRESSGAGTGAGTGAGGAGGSGGAAETQAYEIYFNPDHSSYSLTKQVELHKKNPKAHDALVAKYNLTGY